MAPAEIVAISLIAASLTLALVVWAGVKRLRREAIKPAPDYLPPVSILKPLKGAEHDLQDNLRTFFTQDYPNAELIFGVADINDPAVHVVRALMREYPTVPARLVVDARKVGINPKVNNLANIASHARHQILLISDSNVRVSPGYVGDMVARLESSDNSRRTGLVSSAFVVVGEAGLGGAIERLHVNTFLVGAMTASNLMLSIPMGIGKSQMIRREHIDLIGGWETLANYLAEDQVLAQEISKVGLNVTQAATPVENVIGTVSTKQCLARQIRWASLRVRLTGPVYACELLFPTTIVALIACAISPTATTLWAAIAAVIIKALLDESADATFMGRRRLWLKALWLSPLKDILAGWVWIKGITTSRIEWRGKVYAMGWRTRLSPRIQGEPRSIAPSHSQPTVIVTSAAAGALSAQVGASA